MNRGRIKWEIIKEIFVPKCVAANPKLTKLTKEMVSYWKATEKYISNKKKHTQELVDLYGIDGEESNERWLGFKPPE